MKVESSQPFGDAHIFDLKLNIDEGLGVIHSFLRFASIFQKMSLKFSHRELALRKLIGKFLGHFKWFFWEKLLVESLHLCLTSIVEFNMQVSATRTKKGRIKFLSVISGHDQNATFLGADSVKSIEKAGETDLATS